VRSGNAVILKVATVTITMMQNEDFDGDFDDNDEEEKYDGVAIHFCRKSVAIMSHRPGRKGGRAHLPIAC
jgi:hypothetical protein